MVQCIQRGPDRYNELRSQSVSTLLYVGSDFSSYFLIILQSPAYYNTVNILSFAEITSEWCKLVKIGTELLNETLRKCQEWRAWFHNILDVVQTVKMGTLWSSSVKWTESGLYCFQSFNHQWTHCVKSGDKYYLPRQATQQVAKGVALFQLNVSAYWGSRTLASSFLA